jgi:hypothetical protein
MKNPPYAPSWVDRFQDFLRRLPIPIWASIVLLYLLTTLFFHGAIWVDQALPVGVFSPDLLFNSLWGVVSLSFFFFLDSASLSALDKFSVLVQKKKGEIELLKYKMTTVPSKVANILTLLMAVILLLGFYFDPGILYAGMRSPVAYALTVPLSIAGYAFAPLLIYQGIRVLASVRAAYRLIDEINLFELQPLYAFSAVTLTSGFFWLLIMNMNILGNYVLVEGTESSLILSTLFVTPLIPMAVFSFIYPTVGIHRRIQNKKEIALRDNGRQIERAHIALFKQLDKENHRQSGDIEKSLNSLYKMREQIERIPTWPWSPGTLRNFLSAVFLPLGLWLLQQMLVRMF